MLDNYQYYPRLKVTRNQRLRIGYMIKQISDVVLKVFLSSYRVQKAVKASLNTGTSVLLP